jgi:hypothetical protein
MVKKVSLFILLLAVVIGLLFLFYPEKLREWTEDTPLSTVLPATVVYKWQDREGNWVVTDTPPEEGVPFKVMEYQGDENILPFPEQPKK